MSFRKFSITGIHSILEAANSSPSTLGIFPDQPKEEIILLYLEPSSHHHAQFVHNLDEQSVQCVE